MTNTSQNNISELVLLPLAYLPSTDLYCYIAQRSLIAFELSETFPKQTCRNRTTILTANGTLRLTIPVIKPSGNSSKTNEILIDHKTQWNRIHWRAITSAYNKSPFFLYYRDEIEQLYANPGNVLSDFNLQLIKKINAFLRISPEMKFTAEFRKDYDSVTDKRACTKNTEKTDHILLSYTQVFSDRMPFIPNLSILDLLFNEGPHAVRYLKNAGLKGPE